MSPLGNDFWSDFDGTHSGHDLALAQTMRTVRAIRGVERPRAQVQEEIRAALSHLCAAIEGLVEWMEQERRTDSEALQLLDSLKKIGDDVVRSLSACPLPMIAPRESTDLSSTSPSAARLATDRAKTANKPEVDR